MPSLKETFSKNDKIPFGAYVMYQQVGQLFYQNNLRIKKVDFQKAFHGNNDTGALYINICKNLFLTAQDVSQMLDYVSKGNSIFISSANIDTSLLLPLGITVTKPSDISELMQPLEYTATLLQPPVYNDSSRFAYFYYPFRNHFTTFNKEQVKVLGTNKKGEPDYIVAFYGKGRFYIHCEPRSLSNYFLLQKENYKYLQHLFSFVPNVPEYVFWDDYYNRLNTPPQGEGRNSLSVLLQYPSMAWAFWLLLLMLLLYILFGGKRRQRIVPNLLPNENTTVAFTETISRLYFQNKDNKDIADKMVTYFLEHIRNQYFLNTNHFSEDFAAILSRKSNVEQAITQRVLATISKVQQADKISDEQLISLNQQIEKFYKNSK
jgi:hypothetical protein